MGHAFQREVFVFLSVPKNHRGMARALEIKNADEKETASG